MEKKTIKSGAPFLLAGAGVLAYALVFGVGSLISYVLALAVGMLAFFAGKKAFPNRVIEVERAPQSGDAQTDEMIAEARAQLDAIARANDAIADPALSGKIEEIGAICRRILARLEEQPDMLSSLRTFLRYYLPATLKLLESRAKIEGEVHAGESAQIAARIDDAMDKVLEAFQKQLDALDHYRFINLQSEMDVLSQMLRSDGLIAQEEEEKAAAQEAADDPFAGLFKQGG